MKDKHLIIRMRQCLAIAAASGCEHGKHGAVLVDPERNVLLMDAYNGGPRGGLTSGCTVAGQCLRDYAGVPRGERIEIGCHHAEMNVICNAAAGGVKTAGAWLFCTGEPCLLCAKLIHHAGVQRVFCASGEKLPAKPTSITIPAGPTYLRSHGISVDYFDPQAAGLKDDLIGQD